MLAFVVSIFAFDVSILALSCVKPLMETGAKSL
jgi:hypothetical protein